MLNNKQKTLFILHLPPPIHGAAVVGKYIQQSSHINKEFQCRYINLSTSRTINEIGTGAIIKWWRYLEIIVQIFWNLLVFRPDIVYISLTAKGFGFYKDALLAMLVKSFGKKVVYHFHNKGVIERQNVRIDNWLYKKVFKRAEIILLSKYLYSDIQKYVAKEQVHYCPNGIPDTSICKLVKAQDDERKKVTLLFLSNLIASKGIFVLLDACAILKQKRIPFECVFVGGIGDVSNEQFTKKVCELDLEQEVFYIGKRYGNEKNEIFQNADIFVLPTYYHNECFPLVLLEAMQFSLPIISTLEGGIPEIVEDRQTGFLVPKRDVNALVEKLELLINNKELRASMGIAARNKYEEKFTLGHFEKSLTSILHQIS